MPFKRGAKLKSFFKLPKVFLTFFLIPFVCNASACLYLFYNPPRTLPVSRSANSSFTPIYFQATLPFLAAAKVIAFFIFPNTFKSILNFYPKPNPLSSFSLHQASLPSFTPCVQSGCKYRHSLYSCKPHRYFLEK